MKMSADLDQWLLKPKSGQDQKQPLDHLAAFRKLTISSSTPAKFRLPPILSSDNAATWLVTRKGANNNEDNRNVSARVPDDNSKWLLKPKVETDIVTLTGSDVKTQEEEEYNPWLARCSVMTTSLNSLPGGSGTTFLPSNLVQAEKSIWLSKSCCENVPEKNLDEWLWVAPSRGQNCKNPLEDWETQSLARKWIVEDQAKVEEWLKKALEDQFEDSEDDFDDCSIEVINH